MSDYPKIQKQRYNTIKQPKKKIKIVLLKTIRHNNSDVNEKKRMKMCFLDLTVTKISDYHQRLS